MDLDLLLNDHDLAHALKVAEEAYSANVAAHQIHSVVSGGIFIRFRRRVAQSATEGLYHLRTGMLTRRKRNMVV